MSTLNDLRELAKAARANAQQAIDEPWAVTAVLAVDVPALAAGIEKLAAVVEPAIRLYHAFIDGEVLDATSEWDELDAALRALEEK